MTECLFKVKQKASINRDSSRFNSCLAFKDNKV
uniref:Uncharacterized protein n=1 Tax=Siphoviridae sp. ctnFV5 TaxID=2823600 RepID=A0A8S5L701_9CAUD|nr:MAG TPA: hypothetical protein [Siphoviridae sp. ctnFV5]